MISRAQRTPLSDWAWTIDRWLLAAIAMLIVAGLVFSMAGSPPVAERLHLAVQAGDCVVELRTPGPDKGGALKDFLVRPAH